jgi:hypothetical protein
MSVVSRCTAQWVEEPTIAGRFQVIAEPTQAEPVVRTAG